MRSLDGGPVSLYTAIYGGAALAPLETPSTATPTSATAWGGQDPWDMSSFNLGDFVPSAPTAQSVLSLSEESISSCDDLTPGGDMGLNNGNVDYRNTLLPVNTTGTNNFILDGLHGYGL